MTLLAAEVSDLDPTSSRFDQATMPKGKRYSDWLIGQDALESEEVIFRTLAERLFRRQKAFLTTELNMAIDIFATAELSLFLCLSLSGNSLFDLKSYLYYRRSTSPLLQLEPFSIAASLVHAELMGDGWKLERQFIYELLALR
jgi:hypothetical protein